MNNIRFPRFWITVDYIRRNYRWVEPCLGTTGLLRITRELMDRFRYDMIHHSLYWARLHWYENIDEYIREQGEKFYATQNYVLAYKDYELLGDQLVEH